MLNSGPRATAHRRLTTTASLGLALLTATGLSAARPATADTYNFATLNDPLATGGTFAQGINDLGQIVGEYRTGSGVNHGFLDTNGAFTTLDDPNAASGLFGGGTFALGISGAGQVVGYYQDANKVSHGFLDTGGAFTSIDYPGIGTRDTFALGINNAGQVVGQYRDADNFEHGFLDTGGTFTAFDDPSAAGSTGSQFTGTFANGINDIGQIVGDYQDASGLSHGFLEANGAFASIDYPGAITTDAFGISSGGQIVGEYQDAFTGTHGFLYTGGANGTFATLDDPNGVRSSYVYGINGVGQVVGSYGNATSGYYGFLATPAVPEAPPVWLLLAGSLPVGLMTLRNHRQARCG